MSFHVGLLYSTHRFLDFAMENQIRADEVSQMQERFELTPARQVYKVSQECNWIRISADGFVEVSERGKQIQQVGDASEKLRLQLPDLIDYHKPPWSKKIMYGREEARSSMPPNVEQCFKECGLFDAWSVDLIKTWDGLSTSARSRRSDALQEVGRQAELWSLKYEEKRTRKRPIWQSLESAYSGYDLLSVKSAKDRTRLRIEVKGSERPPRQSTFFLTRQEWSTATRSSNYHFHLWFVSRQPKLFVVDYKHVIEHIAENRGKGSWHNLEIPFSAFSMFGKDIKISQYPMVGLEVS